MALSYFKGKRWEDITREERLFCAHLYYEVKGKEREFISWLHKKTWLRDKKIDLNNEDVKAEWEAGLEVCFYRDYLKRFNESEENKYSPKRTFDLCLFSEKRIIIIEAKVHEGFNTKQNEIFGKDKQQIVDVLGNPNIKVDLLALASSTYYKNQQRCKSSRTLEVFDGLLSWQELYEKYKDKKEFKRANDIYNAREKN